MTAAEIDKAASRAMVKYAIAKQVREILDTAKAQYGNGWDDDDVENEIIELVTSDAD